MISQTHVFFYKEWGSTRDCLQKAIQLGCDFWEMRDEIDDIYSRQFARWMQKRKDWEPRLIYHIWDYNLASLVPPTNQWLAVGATTTAIGGTGKQPVAGAMTTATDGASSAISRSILSDE